MDEARVGEAIEWARRGEYEKAERRFKRYLAEVRGEGGRDEVRACVNLGTLYGIQGRCLESMLLYRRGLLLARNADDALAQVILLANVGGVYAQLGLQRFLPDVVADLEGQLARLSGEQRERAEEYAVWQRLELALWRGDVEAARTALESVAKHHGTSEDPRARASVSELEAFLLESQGLHGQALAVVEAALGTEGLTPPSRLDLLCLRAQLLEELDRGAEARQVAREGLAILEAAAAVPSLAEQCVHANTHLAACLGRVGGDPAVVKRAYDLAATAVLERIRQLDEVATDLPEISLGLRQDRAWIQELRAALQSQQGELMEAVASLLAETVSRGDSPLADVTAEKGVIRICAWCGTVRTASGNWIPVAQYLPVGEGIAASHGICPACLERIRG